MEKKITIELTERELSSILQACSYYMNAIEKEKMNWLDNMYYFTLDELNENNGKFDKAWNELHR